MTANWNKEIILATFLTILLLPIGFGCGSTSLSTLPDVSFTTIKGQHITKDQMIGHPVLVTFWATDCGPCLEEIPDLVALHNEFAAKGLIVVTIAMYYDPPNLVIAMAERKKLPYAVVLDPQAKLSHAFGQIKWTPTNFLFAPNGELALRNRGAFDINSLRDEIREAIDSG